MIFWKTIGGGWPFPLGTQPPTSMSFPSLQLCTPGRRSRALADPASLPPQFSDSIGLLPLSDSNFATPFSMSDNLIPRPRKNNVGARMDLRKATRAGDGGGGCSCGRLLCCCISQLTLCFSFLEFRLDSSRRFRSTS